MKMIVAALLAVMAGACNQTAQSEGPEPVAVSLPAAPALPAEPPPSARPVATAAAELPPGDPGPALYEPLVDTTRVKPLKYREDLQACKLLAIPQAAAIRRATQQQQTGAALQVAGTLASYIPVPGFRQAHVLAGAANAVQSVGEATSEGAGATLERATQDYALIMDNCMTQKRYRLLRS